MDTGISIDMTGLLSKRKRAVAMLEKTGLLKAIGLRQLRWVDDNFRTDGSEVGGWKPLSPFTLAHRKHGGNRPLQDSGLFRASFTPGKDKNILDVTGDQVTIGSAFPWASFHEEGTGPIYPVNGKVLAIPGPGGMTFLRKTAGIPKRKVLPTVTIGKDLAERLIKARVEQIENG